MSQEIDQNRRHFLTVATTVVGATGVVLTAVPFVSSMEPSAKALAQGAPVDVDISKIESGALIKARWRGKPIWIMNRPQSALAQLPKNDPLLRDPNSDQPQQPAYCKNTNRSLKPGTFVLVPICTHLGCIPLYRPNPGDPGIGPNWPGGMHCPCHGSLYDLAGRVFKNVPAPLNLPVPKHRYLDNRVIRIGEDPKDSNSNWTKPLVW
ncbi:MAG: ubiquinol-cytochrome c reductase iron-sulfur subunit [Gammaproteobacteria bacterium]